MSPKIYGNVGRAGGRRRARRRGKFVSRKISSAPSRSLGGFIPCVKRMDDGLSRLAASSCLGFRNPRFTVTTRIKQPPPTPAPSSFARRIHRLLAVSSHRYDAAGRSLNFRVLLSFSRESESKVRAARSLFRQQRRHYRLARYAARTLFLSALPFSSFKREEL